MPELVRGQRMKLGDLTGATAFEVGLSVPAKTAGGSDLDVACFGLDGDGKLSDDRYFVFYNQKSSPEGAIGLRGASGGDREVFAVDLGRLPPTIQRLVFTLTADPGRLAELDSGALRLLVGSEPVATFAFRGRDFAEERAVILAELYRKDVWRFAATAQGFAGGLSALLAHFGGQEIAPPPAPVAAPIPSPPPPQVVPVPVPVPTPTVSLTKVTLEKAGTSRAVDLRKGGGSQPIAINLNWDDPSGSRRGFLGIGRSQKPDLDLGCMYRMADGTIGVIQPLGRRFGSRHQPPYIFLDKDDRTGAAEDGENLTIERPDLIDRVMVFALIYEGAANFATVHARLTIKDQNGSETLIPLNNPDPRQSFCSICVIDRRGDRIEITKEERYYPDHSKADQQYGFGFTWVAGQK